MKTTRKLVSTEMLDASIGIRIASFNPDGSTSESVSFEFPFSLVSPQTALHIASVLSQDATFSQSSGDPKDSVE